MTKTVARLALVVGLLVLTAFIVIVIGQTAQVVELAARIAPWLGNAVLWTLLVIYAACIAVPVFMLLRLPRPLQPPESESDPAFAAHLDRLRERLRKNPHLAGRSLATREEIEAGLTTLNGLADERTKQIASQVFVTTAISQNGSLDTLLVLTAQSRLILAIARTYNQRPDLRELIRLYANVAATALVAGELEDLDLAEQMQPVIAAVFGSAAGAIPGFGAATTLFVNSVTTGSANAFLTLRVGAIAKQYCAALVLPARRTIRRTALVEATRMLGGIALTGTRRVAAALGSATKNSIGGVFESFGDQIKAAGSGIAGMGAAAASRLGLRRPPEGSGA